MTPAPADAGLQPERTALAWRRTALLMAVNAMVALRTGLASGDGRSVAAATALGAVALLLALAGSLRQRRLAQAPAAVSHRLLLWVVGATWLAGAVALLQICRAGG
ncbi:DUF202 domain-containing protein [Aquabacterium sp. J223]|uniref:DUF202 domain-containing protein n=1 Tax=Aquabacterium sp. J223 TaxID=2898431 RepID=UPI0021AD811D|nr:DUF202 domain-containing protein [Aquabacterium sp. J223]UUX95950.1 DUF202 domain-containing protein [Aquabacterium sp. J223]